MLTRASFEGTPAEWDALCSRFAEFSINQSHAWGEGRRGDGWSVARDVWRDARGEAAAAAMVLRRRVKGLPLAYVSRGPMVLAEGVTPEEAEARFVSCIGGYRRALRPGELLVCALYQSYAEIGPTALRAAGLRPLFGPSGAFAYTSIVELTDRDTLLRQASSDWRKLYRRSAALEERVLSSDAPEDFLRARELVSRVEASKGFSTNLTPSLVTAMAKGRARLFWIADEAGEPAAALLVAIAGRRASRFLAGVAPGAARGEPGIARILEVAASRWAFEQGARYYDLEGLHPFQRGVTDFKIGMRGRMVANAGLHAASRPTATAAALSHVRRRAWQGPLHLWRASKPYFLHVALRRLSRGRVQWESLRMYQKDLEGSGRTPRSGFSTVVLDRYDREDFHYRLGTTAELWGPCQDLAPGRKECVVVLAKDGFAAAYGFVTWGGAELSELGTVLPLEADEAYVSNCYVIPEMRGNHLYRYLLEDICGRLRARGVRRALIATSPFNLPSVRGIESAGFVPFREARLSRGPGWNRLRWEAPPQAV